MRVALGTGKVLKNRSFENVVPQIEAVENKKTACTLIIIGKGLPLGGFSCKFLLYHGYNLVFVLQHTAGRQQAGCWGNTYTVKSIQKEKTFKKVKDLEFSKSYCKGRKPELKSAADGHELEKVYRLKKKKQKTFVL